MTARRIIDGDGHIIEDEIAENPEMGLRCERVRG